MTKKNHPTDTNNTQTIQELLDERVVWSDGNQFERKPLTYLQWLIFFLVASGKFFEGLALFIISIALPLISFQFRLNTIKHSVISSAVLIGILIGAFLFGRLADIFGRKKIFITTMLVFSLSLLGYYLSSNFYELALCLLFIGVALGGDYPLGHILITECLPSFSRGRLILFALSFQSLGALVGTIIGYMVLRLDNHLDAWRYMFLIATIPSFIVLALRCFIPESPYWLFTKNKMQQVNTVLNKLRNREMKLDLSPATKIDSPADNKKKQGIRGLFKNHFRQTILASVPWFLQDLGTYGIGIFTPTILLLTIGHHRTHLNVASLVYNDLLAARGAIFIDLLLLVGFIGAIIFVDKVGRIKLQIIGFIGCALGLLMSAISTLTPGSTHLLLLFAGFMLFNFMTNLGPNSMTYLLAGELYPSHVRGTGSGFAAMIAKCGACITAFIFPIFLEHNGVMPILVVLIGTSLLGALVTFIYRIDTRKIDADD